MTALPLTASIPPGARLSPSLSIPGWLLLIAATLAMAGLAVVLMLLVPSYKSIFAEFGVQLPWTAGATLRLSEWLTGSSPGQSIAGAAIIVPLALMTLAGAGVLAAQPSRRCKLTGHILLAALMVCSLLGAILAIILMQGPLVAIINSLQSGKP